MSENIDLNKTVYNKTQYEKTIDTSFNQLGVQTIQEQIDQQPTVGEFFDLYNSLFYDIPERGSNTSHEYLIQQSSEYINFSQNNDEVNALRQEISQLRTELLDAQQQIVELQISNSQNSLQTQQLAPNFTT
tara:strand:+ start:4980 stop:5372 length:393 start_codon:yes stop_codon:yes gene_type:complete